MWRERWGPRTEPSPSHPPWRGQTSGTSPLGGDFSQGVQENVGLINRGMRLISLAGVLVKLQVGPFLGIDKMACAGFC